MIVHVRLFASLREVVEVASVELELPEGATAEAAWAELVRRWPGLERFRRSLGVAVDRRYVPFSQALAAGDEVVFVPPVSGG